MRIPDFKSEEGSVLYKNTVGKLISPRVAEVLSQQIQPVISKFNSVLDLGCGPGTLCLPLAEAHPDLRITAVDASEAMVDLVRTSAEERGLHNLRIATMDAGHIDLDPASFDAVLCNLAFPFFPRPYDSTRELFTVVKPGGQVYFTVPGRNTWNEFFQVAEEVLGDMIQMARPFLSKFTQAEVLPAALEGAGFEQVSEIRTLLPFQFANGQDVLSFFGELFHLLDYAPNDVQADLAEAIDRHHPDGFTMHYEAVLRTAKRPCEKTC